MDQDTNSEPAAGKPISSRQSPPGDRKSEQGVVKRSGEYGRNSRGGKRRRFEGKSPNGHDGRNKGKNMGSSRTKEVGHGEYLYVLIISYSDFWHFHLALAPVGRFKICTVCLSSD
jgi:hypothetical protein